MRFSVIVLVVCLAFNTHVFAWSGPGHMVVAAIAYRDLNQQERQQITQVLTAHPDAEKWQTAIFKDNPEADEGLVLMMGASTWPDSLRFSHSKWNHKEWHYVDYPITPPDFPIKASPAPQNDIVFAINLCLKSLKDPSTSPADKACWMSWLIHLVGDIHQPLHCCALVNAEFAAPDGDRGGNLIFVKATEASKGIPLHKMWDDAMGTARGFHATQFRSYSNKAVLLSSQLKRVDAEELTRSVTPEQWARESWKIAVEDVYLRGSLRYGTYTDVPPVLPDGYTKKLKSISAARITLGGYRLADLIRGSLMAR